MYERQSCANSEKPHGVARYVEWARVVETQTIATLLEWPMRSYQATYPPLRKDELVDHRTS